MSTDQSWVPNDSATIDSDGGGALDGTAHFDLFASDDCGVSGSDASVYDEDIVVLPAGGANQTVETSNVDTYIATSSSEYSWLVSYDSNLAGQASIAPTCVEVTTLTIDNDNTD